MPELPEVETIKNGLKKVLIHQRIDSVVIKQPKLRWEINKEKLIKNSVGASILSLERRAKYLIINLDNSYSIIIHLGMSGKLLFNTTESLNKHDHLIFKFIKNNKQEKNSELRYRDARRFGMVDIEKSDNLNSSKYFNHLGVEPLSENLKVNLFYPKYSKSLRNIKSFLMDATKIVGVGNIYACEVLFLAKIHPETKLSSLYINDWEEILDATKKTIKKAIDLGGTSFRDYQHSDGSLGYFQNHLNVYQRENEVCRNEDCQKKNIAIIKITQNNRSSFFCPKCQIYKA